jgi:hypothetical protein
MRAHDHVPVFNPRLIDRPGEGLFYEDGRVVGAVDGAANALVIHEWSSYFASQGNTTAALKWLRSQGYTTIAANGVGTVDDGVGDIATAYWAHMLGRGLVDVLIDDNGEDITEWPRQQGCLTRPASTGDDGNCDPPAQTEPGRYALVNRPAGYATLPSGLRYRVEARPAKGQPHHDVARHGILVPERPLTDAETQAFELVPLVEGADAVGHLAFKIAVEWQCYAEAYLESHEDDPELFAKGVMERAERMKVSVDDPGALVASVLSHLSSATTAQC